MRLPGSQGVPCCWKNRHIGKPPNNAGCGRRPADAWQHLNGLTTVDSEAPHHLGSNPAAASRWVLTPITRI